MKYLVIVNPISGRGYAEKAIPRIEAEMRKQGLDFDLVRTERPWHAAELAEQAARNGYDVVVTASGDGTANESLNGLVRAQKAGHNKTALALLPVGTGNDMGYGLGIRGQLEENIQTLAKNYRRKIDIGFVWGGDYPEGRTDPARCAAPDCAASGHYAGIRGIPGPVLQGLSRTDAIRGRDSRLPA